MPLSKLTDTSPAVEALRLKLIGSLSPEERAARMSRLSAFGKLAMLEGLRERNPELSENDLLILLAKNMWGDGFAEHIRLKLERNGKL